MVASDVLSTGTRDEFGVELNAALPYIPLRTIRLSTNDFAPGNTFGGYSTPRFGSISKSIGSTAVTGVGTAFLIQVQPGDLITFNNGSSAKQIVARVDTVIDNLNLTLTSPVVAPLTGDVTYTNETYYVARGPQYERTIMDADPRIVTTSQSGNRFYYGAFYAWNWNTSSMQELASAYALSVGGSVLDLGWEDASSWETVVSTLLTFAGWNATITTTPPDASTIDNSNQEIVIYYTTDTESYNGLGTTVVKTMSFVEQSNAPEDYKTIIGQDPFRQNVGGLHAQYYFNATEFYGSYTPAPGGTTSPNAGVLVTVPAEYGSDSILIGELYTTYNETNNLDFTDKDFAEGQFQVFMKYTIYDGLEAIAAEKLTEQGIQVTPENVDWFRQSIERLGRVEELEWPFDEQEAPEQTDPETYSPEGYDPESYEPRNAKGGE